MDNECKHCIGKYEYKTSLPCRYCKWNKEPYSGRVESKMINDCYIHSEENKNTNMPY